jgi:hypothetical protein
MVFDLQAALPRLLPKAIAWAEARATETAHTGTALDETRLAIARRVGVVQPELIRIALVSRLPQPDDPELLQAAQLTGLLGPNMAGLTLGYGIYICHGQDSIRLISHECRHVHQYEQAGSIAAFLPIYLQQIATVGYADAPYEIDARAHEQHYA